MILSVSLRVNLASDIIFTSKFNLLPIRGAKSKVAQEDERVVNGETAVSGADDGEVSKTDAMLTICYTGQLNDLENRGWAHKPALLVIVR